MTAAPPATTAPPRTTAAAPPATTAPPRTTAAPPATTAAPPVKGCTKDEEAKRVGDFRADVSKNIENLKKIAGSNAQVLELMKARVTCAGMEDFVSTICTG